MFCFTNCTVSVIGCSLVIVSEFFTVNFDSNLHASLMISIKILTTLVGGNVTYNTVAAYSSLCNHRSEDIHISNSLPFWTHFLMLLLY